MSLSPNELWFWKTLNVKAPRKKATGAPTAEPKLAGLAL